MGIEKKIQQNWCLNFYICNRFNKTTAVIKTKGFHGWFELFSSQNNGF